MGIEDYRVAIDKKTCSYKLYKKIDSVNAEFEVAVFDPSWDRVAVEFSEIIVETIKKEKGKK